MVTHQEIVHQEIVAAYRELKAGQPRWCLTVHLPRADAPTGHPLRDDEYVSVTRTVSALENAVLTGKTACRQRRLLRLLREAEE